MSIIGKELGLFIVVGLVMKLGVWIGTNINETLGISIGFICFPVATFIFFRMQKKVFKHWKEKGLFGNPSEKSGSE